MGKSGVKKSIEPSMPMWENTRRVSELKNVWASSQSLVPITASP